MGTRDPDPTIDYVLFWLEYGARQIVNDPGRGVHHWTHVNFSGGYSGWEDPMDKVYFNPKTLEERLLQGQVHKAMVVALAWVLAAAETNTPKEWSPWGDMDLSEAYRIAHMVAKVDPLQACLLKIRLNKISLRMGKTLKELADINFLSFMGPTTGIQW